MSYLRYMWKAALDYRALTDSELMELDRTIRSAEQHSVHLAHNGWLSAGQKHDSKIIDHISDLTSVREEIAEAVLWRAVTRV